MKRQFKHKVTGITGELKSGYLHFQRCYGDICGIEIISEVFVLGSSDWEEVTLEYKILSLEPTKINRDHEILTGLDDINAWLEGTAKEYWGIHSVKRLSDGEIFTVGDSTGHGVVRGFIYYDDDLNTLDVFVSFKYSLKNVKKLKPLFKSKDGEQIYQGESWFYVTDEKPEKGVRRTCILEYRGTNPSKITQFKYEQNAIDYLATLEPLFKTVKNQNIYKGDEYWVINTATWSSPWKKKAEARTQIANTWVLFLTEAEAVEYALMNKPCLSINEIAKVYTTANHYNSYKKEYTKQGEQLRRLVIKKI